MTRLTLLPFLLFAMTAMENADAQKKMIHPAQGTTEKRMATNALLNRPTADTSPIRKAIFNKQINVNPTLITGYGNFSSTDTVWNLTPYLQSKADCNFEKAIDSNGCILVRYTDGLTKKICDGKLTEVVTPDGRKHVARLAGTTMLMYVIPVPAPPNPSDTDTASRWLTHYNENLMDEISGLFADDPKLISQFTSNEQAKCSGSLYKQIEFRTIFIEEFLKAK